MRRLHPLRTVPLLALLGILAVACNTAGGTGTTGVPTSTGAASTAVGAAPFIPQPVSSETIVGTNRYLFGIDDPSGTKSIGTPDLKVQVGFQSAGPPATTIQPTAARFVWAIPDERGLYAVEVTFPTAGDWTAVFRASGPSLPAANVSFQFEVQEKGYAVPIGGAAPSVATPTAATLADIARIATDPTPDPSFYTTSEDEALARHLPFVLVFATPAFCVSRICGPTLDVIKAVARTEPGMLFINAEPYQLKYADGRLQPALDASNQLQATDAVRAWGIVSEPWTFVVDGKGIVRGSFEAVVSPEELKAAIAAAR
ncbi:MAG: hypothetical protein ACXWW6_04390 [Candidatus Limnocylindrales bacterium]